MKKLLTSILLFPCFLQAQTLKTATSPHNPSTEENRIGYLWMFPIGEPPKLFEEKDKESGELIQAVAPSGESVPRLMSLDSNNIPKEVKSKLGKNKLRYQLILARNALSEPLLYQTNRQTNLKLNYEPTEFVRGSGFNWSFTIPSEQQHTLAVITPKQYESTPWKAPALMQYDVSPSRFKDKAIMVINLSYADLYMKIGEKTAVIKPNKSIVSDSIEGKKQLVSIVRHKDKRSYVLREYMSMKEGTRKLIVAYSSPSSGAKVKVRLCQASIATQPDIQWFNNMVSKTEQLKKAKASPTSNSSEH